MENLLMLLRQRSTLRVFLITLVLYGMLYLFATRQLVLGGEEGMFDWIVVPDWRSLIWRQRYPFSFEPIARLTVGNVSLFLSPANVLIGLILAILVALNITAAAAQLRSVGIYGGGGVVGLLGMIPAVVSGTACCVPTVILLLGLQFTAFLTTLWPWLLPLSVFLLSFSLWWSLRNPSWSCQLPKRSL